MEPDHRRASLPRRLRVRGRGARHPGQGPATAETQAKEVERPAVADAHKPVKAASRHGAKPSEIKM